jgi:hypothetical protein
VNAKRILLAAALLALLVPAAGDAQTAAPAPAPTLAPAAKGMGQGKMMGQGVRGRGMMGGRGMGGGMCGMANAAEHVEVENLADGVKITLRSTDPASVKRMQKMAEAMRLMHEAETQ